MRICPLERKWIKLRRLKKSIPEIAPRSQSPKRKFSNRTFLKDDLSCFFGLSLRMYFKVMSGNITLRIHFYKPGNHKPAGDKPQSRLHRPADASNSRQINRHECHQRKARIYESPRDFESSSILARHWPGGAFRRRALPGGEFSNSL